MRTALRLLFAGIFVAMVAVTLEASLERNVFTAAAALWPDAWFRATLADAYFGFVTVWVWVAYRERTHGARAAWLVAFLTLGNLAMAAYVLLALARLPAGAPLWQALLRPEHRTAGTALPASAQR
jgi:hypothetical protein